MSILERLCRERIFVPLGPSGFVENPGRGSRCQMDGVGVEGGDHRKVVTATVRAKNNCRVESKYG